MSINKAALVNAIFEAGVCTERTPASEKFYKALSIAQLTFQLDTHAKHAALKLTIKPGLRALHTGHNCTGTAYTCTNCSKPVEAWYAITNVPPIVRADGGRRYVDQNVKLADGTWTINNAQGVYAYCLDCATN